MGYTTHFNPENYIQIEHITKELPKMQVGDIGRTAPVPREVAYIHRRKYYDYCSHMGIKHQYVLRTIEVPQGTVLEIRRVATDEILEKEPY